MVYIKEVIGLCALIVAVAATGYQHGSYHGSYQHGSHHGSHQGYHHESGHGSGHGYHESKHDSPKYHSYSHHEKKGHGKDVELHKLCSWNVVEFEQCNLRGDAWHPLKLDAGRNYIPENNIPTGFAFSEDGRVFVSLARERKGVYATLAYFNLKDVRDGCCPKLRAYPSDEDNSLDADCCNARNLVNVKRFTVDNCNRLWAVDRNALDLNDKNWVLGSPKLVVYDLKTNKLDREVLIPSEFYYQHQLGLDSVVVNADPKDPGNSHAYVVDTYNGCIVVYSYKQNKFWKVCSPEFYSDAKYSKFCIKTRKHKEVTYYREELVYDCTVDSKRQEALCHSVASLDEFTVPLAELESQEVARCAPDSLNVKYLGQKCRNGQTSTHHLSSRNRVVWGLQELNHGVGCWNRENKLSPDAVDVVVSSLECLPYPADLQLTNVDLNPYCHSRKYGRDETYVVVLSNNRAGIYAHGFDHKEENFAFYFFVESEALECNPQCAPSKGHSHHHGHHSAPKPYHHEAPKPYHEAPKPHHEAPKSYHDAPVYHHTVKDYVPSVSYRYRKSDESAAATAPVAAPEAAKAE